MVGLDDPSNLVLEQREGRIVVKDATVEKLVERLTHARYSGARHHPHDDVGTLL